MLWTNMLIQSIELCLTSAPVKRLYVNPTEFLIIKAQGSYVSADHFCSLLSQTILRQGFYVMLDLNA